MALSVSMAALVGLLVHSALYGVYIVFFIGALYVAYTKRISGYLRGIDTFLLTMTVALFLLITAEWIVQIIRMTDAFVDGHFQNYYPGNTPQNAANIALHVGQIIVADSTMLYRLYIVWRRSRRIIIIPLILIIALIVTGSGAIYSTSPISRTTEELGLFLLSPIGDYSMIVSFLGATLVLNLIISGLISYRIWSINREVTGLTGKHKTYSIVYILLENATLYVGCIGSSLIGFILQDAYQFTIMDSTGPAIGIAFCLIIVWVGLGMDIETTSQVFSDLKFHHSTGVPERSIHR
ncbi:hypothetical protein BD779DRAFT_433796 [Infundibulicybe gibba]|nr:hypothetical protein BD779DRAFT_433796 [Infundibulicybe gibba]